MSVNLVQIREHSSDFPTLRCQVASIRSNFLHEGTCSSLVSLSSVDIVICIKLYVVIFWSGLLCPLSHIDFCHIDSFIAVTDCTVFYCLLFSMLFEKIFEIYGHINKYSWNGVSTKWINGTTKPLKISCVVYNTSICLFYKGNSFFRASCQI